MKFNLPLDLTKLNIEAMLNLSGGGATERPVQLNINNDNFNVNINYNNNGVSLEWISFLSDILI